MNKLTEEELKPCKWEQSKIEQSGIFETSCENQFCFLEGGPKDNDFRFCPYCGEPLAVLGEA